MERVLSFLSVPTPPGWAQAAVQDLETLLLDHAGLELKAAHQAQRLIWKYGSPDGGALPSAEVQMALLHKMSRLAREELRHYEQVLAIIESRGVRYRPLTASGYARALHEHVRSNEPERLIDTLIVGALIEARSCERFAALVPLLDDQEPELASFYRSLLRSEARHFEDYLHLAKAVGGASIDARVAQLCEVEAAQMHVAGSALRFHSGVAPTSASGATR